MDINGLMVAKIINAVMFDGVHSAVKYVDPKVVIKATKRGRGEKVHIEILVTIGRPNYAERQFIKDCIKAGESFPIKKIQLTLLPSK